MNRLGCILSIQHHVHKLKLKQIQLSLREANEDISSINNVMRFQKCYSNMKLHSVALR